MNKRLFFLKGDGWSEFEMSGKLLKATQEELILWAYEMMERYGYRNYLITENPGCIIGRRFRGVVAGTALSVVATIQPA